MWNNEESDFCNNARYGIHDLALSNASSTVYKEMDFHDCFHQNPASRFQMWCKNIRFGSVMNA